MCSSAEIPRPFPAVVVVVVAIEYRAERALVTNLEPPGCSYNLCRPAFSPSQAAGSFQRASLKASST
ncbi:MAG: hypothetical protein WBG92_03795, partial [Thiohalocapsa sp.]